MPYERVLTGRGSFREGPVAKTTTSPGRSPAVKAIVGVSAIVFWLLRRTGVVGP